MSVGCELCEAAPLTPRWFEDDLCWVAECESCSVPMVVWRTHGAEPPAEVKERMLDRLREVADVHGPARYWVDEVPRTILDHWHAHARRRWS